MRERVLLLSVLLPALFLSIPAQAGNYQPTLWLEVWNFEEEPADSIPGSVCTHTETGYPFNFPCTSPKSPYAFGFLVVHVGSLDLPTCPTLGVGCEQYGGYAGLCFGVVQTGRPAVFATFEACPGFAVAYCGGQHDIIVVSTESCHDWPDHPGYLKYVNLSPSVEPTYFGIVNNATTGHHKVQNCSLGFDDGTEVGGCAAWGGEQFDSDACGGYAAGYLCGFTPVSSTTWGSIKSLFR